MLIAPVLAGCRRALIGTGWAISSYLAYKGIQKHFSALYDSISGNVDIFRMAKITVGSSFQCYVQAHMKIKIEEGVPTASVEM